MKKIIFIFFVLLMCFVFYSHMPAESVETEYEIYKQYCPQPPYNIADEGTRSFQSKTGLNAIASKIAAMSIKKSIKNQANGKFKVKVQSYSLTDAKQGKFKSFEVKGKKINASDIYISNLYAKTTCHFIHLDTEKNPVQLIEPMAIDFNAEISEEDINKTLQTPTYQNFMVKIKHKSIKISLFEFSNPRVSLKDNLFDFTVDVRTLRGKPFSANVISKLKIENNKIVLENIKLGTTNYKIAGTKMKYLLKIFDPIQYMQDTLKQYNCKTILKSAKIDDGKIKISGSVFLGKN